MACSSRSLALLFLLNMASPYINFEKTCNLPGYWFRCHNKFNWSEKLPDPRWKHPRTPHPRVQSWDHLDPPGCLWGRSAQRTQNPASTSKCLRKEEEFGNERKKGRRLSEKLVVAHRFPSFSRQTRSYRHPCSLWEIPGSWRRCCCGGPRCRRWK